MKSYEFVPPGNAKRLWSWLLPNRRWGVVIMFCPWMFHLGIEAWRHGVCLNLGPLSLGVAETRPLADAPMTPAPQVERDKSRDDQNQ